MRQYEIESTHVVAFVLVQLVVHIETGHHLNHVAGFPLVGRRVVEVEGEWRALSVEAPRGCVKIVRLSKQEVVVVGMQIGEHPVGVGGGQMLLFSA